MTLIRTAALAAVGYAAWHFMTGTRQARRPAFAEGEGAAGNFAQVRNAGPEAMADPAPAGWSRVDETSDESFPASDPPATY